MHCKRPKTGHMLVCVCERDRERERGGGRERERKSGVEGESVDLGGRCIIKKKKNNKKYNLSL